MTINDQKFIVVTRLLHATFSQSVLIFSFCLKMLGPWEEPGKKLKDHPQSPVQKSDSTLTPVFVAPASGDCSKDEEMGVWGEESGRLASYMNTSRPILLS